VGGVGQSLSIALHNLQYLDQGRGVALPPLDEDAEHNLVLNLIVMLTSSVVCVGTGNIAHEGSGAEFCLKLNCNAHLLCCVCRRGKRCA
jgi:hypothetical protein